MAAAGRVVVVGGGFGGVEAVKALARSGLEITLIDRHNYFLFQPLNYQVATGGLAPGDIAVPLRHAVRRWANVDVLLGEVSELDLAGREVVVTGMASGAGEPVRLGYSSLIVAGGSDYLYFGYYDLR